MLKHFVSLFIFYFFVNHCVCERSEKLKLIIDNDAGGDDAMAIFLALLHEQKFNGPKVVGLTTGNGNTCESNVYRNNQRILKVVNRQDVPIYRGSSSSLLVTPKTNDYYGKDGLGDYEDNITDLVPANEINAVTALIELSKKYEGKLVVVTIGTLTNVALAIKIDPGFLGRLAQLYVGGGHIHSDLHPQPEFNVHMDAEAYHIIAHNARPDIVTLHPFSQTIIGLNFSKEWRQDVLGAIESDVIKAQNKYERLSMARNKRWQSLDPSVISVALRPDLVEEFKYSKNDIILCGEQRGINTNTFVDKDDANVRVVYSFKSEEYKKFLLDVFSGVDVPC